MNLLLVDVETTGLDPATDEAIEVGAVLYSVGYRTVLQQVSTLIPCEENAAYDINKINPGSSDVLPELTLLALNCMAQRANFAMAHNAEFDRKWFDYAPLRDVTAARHLEWIDSMDLPWAGCRPNSSLVDLALAHGVPVVSAHRALDDCRLLADVLSKQSDLLGMLEITREPKYLVVADVSYEDRAVAKKHGFIWDSLVSKCWARKLRDRDIDSLPFSVRRIEPPTCDEVTF